MTMTAHTAAEPSNPEPEPTPSGPNLPELYRLLSTLIQDPGEFFDGLIEIEANPGQVTVTPWHLNSAGNRPDTTPKPTGSTSTTQPP